MRVLQTRKIFALTAVFLLVGIVGLEPKCSSMKEKEALKIVAGIRSQANWEAKQQFDRFDKVLMPYMKGQEASDLKTVLVVIVDNFGLPSLSGHQKYYTGYKGVRSDIGYPLEVKDLVVCVYLFYWNKGGDETGNLDPYFGIIRLSTKYDLLLLVFINDEILIVRDIQCMR